MLYSVPVIQKIGKKYLRCKEGFVLQHIRKACGQGLSREGAYPDTQGNEKIHSK